MDGIAIFFLKQLLSENDQCRGYLKGGNSNLVFEGTERKIHCFNCMFSLAMSYSWLFGGDGSNIRNTSEVYSKTMLGS